MKKSGLKLLADLSRAQVPANAIIFFESSSCAVCKRMLPVITTLQKEGYPIVRINVKDFPELVKQLKITTTPTLIVQKNNKEVASMVGYSSETQLRRFIEMRMPLKKYGQK